jgi:hypothetical protein
MILDDHKVTDNFATPGYNITLDNKLFNVYLKIALKAYRNYQCNLFNNSFNKNTINYSYSVIIGKYNIILIDERNTFLYNKTAIDDYTINFVKSKLNNKDTLIISPRPFAHLCPIHAFLQGLVYGDGVDELLHPINLKNTLLLREILFNHKKNNIDKLLYIISGDIHETFIQSHIKNNIEIKELVSSAISRLPRKKDSLLNNIIFWIQRNFNTLSFYGVKNRHSHSLDNNYGFMKNDILYNSF